MFKHVEFLIQGDLLPMTIGRLQVSPSFVIEEATSKKDLGGFFALAFVGVKDEPDFFRRASLRIDFFLLLHALMNGQAATYFQGVATPLSTLDDLGKNRFSFSGYEEVVHLNEDMQSELSKPILLVKERFFQLEEDIDKILDEHVGLALSYYYSAVQASSKSKFAEVVIDLAIAAEALFSKEQPYTANLRRRLSSFVAQDELERKEISKKIDEFYRLRGIIVHGEKKEIPLADVRTASEHIRKAIDKALSSKLYSKAELIHEVDKS